MAGYMAMHCFKGTHSLSYAFLGILVILFFLPLIIYRSIKSLVYATHKSILDPIKGSKVATFRTIDELKK